MNRRRFLVVLAGTGAVLGGGSYSYLCNKKMEKAPEKDGRIIADLHTHVKKHWPLEDILSVLSCGITGLSAVYFTKSQNSLTYRRAVNLPGVEELEPGLLARLVYQGKTGYFLQAQEVRSQSKQDILALGCKKIIEDSVETEKIIKEIHQQGGLAILNHPYVIPSGSWPVKYRLLTEEEAKGLEKILPVVDEVEVFNAQNINLLPFIAWMHRANEQAEKLASDFGHKGTASSDGRVPEQIHVSGIYLPSENLSWEAIKHHIQSKNFERHEQYISKISFLNGNFFS